MVGRVPLKRCWTYLSEQTITPYPILEFVVHNPVIDRELNVMAKVDTGFSGDPMLTPREWGDLKLDAAVIPEAREYWTFTGPLRTRMAQVLLAFPGLDLKFEAVAETPISGSQRTLVGRGVLNKLFMELRGPEMRCCVFVE